MSASQALALAASAILLAAVIFSVAAWSLRGPEDGFARAFLRLVLRLYLRAVHRVHRDPGSAGEPIPLEGPAIVVANHRSGVDPLILAICTPRVIHFLMAREYYERPGLRWLFRLAGAIPVNRDGNDLGATKSALKALREGRVIGIFPEGGIQIDGAAEQGSAGKAGVALLALRSGAPVVPAHITGTPNLDSVLRAMLTPSRSAVRFGERQCFAPSAGGKPTREEMEEVTRRILGRIRDLRPEELPATEALEKG